MQYNFDEVIERRGTDSLKYDEVKPVFGTDDLIPLWVADMDFRTAEPILEACRARAELGIFGYSAKSPDFFEAACAFERRRHGWALSPADLATAPGVVPSLSALVQLFTEPGDCVLIQTPVYPEFYDVVECWEGRSVLENRLIANADGSWDIDFDDFEAQLRRGPKLFLLCNPQNPVGRIWRRDELERMGQLCVRYGVMMVSDEIHGDLELFANHYVPAGTLSEPVRANTISCFSATKTFNLAGLQTNCVAFPQRDWKLRFERHWKRYEIHRCNAFSLPAMRAAWLHGDEWLDQLCAYLSDNMLLLRNFFAAEVPEIRMHLPEATYLAWLDCRGLAMPQDALSHFFIEQAHVGLGNGASYQRGSAGYMRLNAACPRSVLRQALEQIRSAVRAR